MRLEPSSNCSLLNCNAALSMMIGDVSLQVAKQVIAVSAAIIWFFIIIITKFHDSIGRLFFRIIKNFVL